MHKLESILENEMCHVLWDFAIQTDHLISIQRPDLVIDKKKGSLSNCGLCRRSRLQIKLKENKKRDIYLYLARELKNCVTCM